MTIQWSLPTIQSYQSSQIFEAVGISKDEIGRASCRERVCKQV